MSARETESAGISVVILTLNEETNIGPCLDSVAWSDDVIVVDSASEDDTVRSAQETRPDVRVFTNPFEDFGQQRNWAIDHAEPRHGWILFLDADERCTPACADELRRSVRAPGECVGFFLAARNIFLGKWIRHCTLYPSWQLRLLKVGSVRYRKEGHGQREVTDGPLGYIREPYDHYPVSKGLEEWFSRHNVYSSNEVGLLMRLKEEPLRVGELFAGDAVVRRRALKRLAARVGFRPFFKFVYLYILKAGFLDGRPGYRFCMMRVANDMHIEAKLAEARHDRGKN